MPIFLDLFINYKKLSCPPSIVQGLVLEVKAIGDALGLLKPLENWPVSLSNTPIKYEQLIPYYAYRAMSLAASEKCGTRFDPSIHDRESM